MHKFIYIIIVFIILTLTYVYRMLLSVKYLKLVGI